MQANELRMAVTKVVNLLDKANIASLVNQYRAAKGDQRTEASEGLQQAAGFILKQFASMSASERKVTRILHLDSLGTREYWVDLFASSDDPRRHQGEIVRLASRILFATNHLPGLLNLVDDVNADPQSVMQAPGQGNSYLCIRLTDAGERAADPDRVARSIDGIDMLYVACASIARKPAIELRIDNVIPRRNGDRDLVFVGENDSIAAVYDIIHSIPEALAELNPEQELDLDSVVQALPVFADLNTLATTGVFSGQDISDFRDTLQQGALLVLESGVIALDPAEMLSMPAASNGAFQHNGASRGLSADNTAVRGAAGASVKTLKPSSQLEPDEHYERYLRERAAMLASQDGAKF